MRSQRKLTSEIILLLSACLAAPVVATLALVTACPVFAQTTSQLPTDKLVDRYFFTGDNEGLYVQNHARIMGQSGSLLELRNNGTVNLLSGTLTITTSSTPVKVSAGTHEISISPLSQVSVRNNNGVVVSVNASRASETTGIADGAVSRSTLRSGETYPPGETQIAPSVAHGPVKPPLFVVGNGMLQLSGSTGTLSLLSREIFFCPSRALKIVTPLGLVTASAQTRFLVSVSPGMVRIFNCRSGAVKFNSGSNFRNIMPSEEFCVFDHRPTREEVLPEDGIGRREITLHDLDKAKTTASTNTFSLVSLLTSSYFLGDWKRRSAFDKKLETSLIKSAAAGDGAKPGGQAFYQTPAFQRVSQTGLQ